MILEKKTLSRKKQPLASYCKGLKMWEAGTEPDAKDPQKQGLFNDGGSLTPQFSPHQNYFEQILSFFDSLEPSEQESLLDALKERVKAAK